MSRAGHFLLRGREPQSFWEMGPVYRMTVTRAQRSSVQVVVGAHEQRRTSRSGSLRDGSYKVSLKGE